MPKFPYLLVKMLYTFQPVKTRTTYYCLHSHHSIYRNVYMHSTIFSFWSHFFCRCHYFYGWRFYLLFVLLSWKTQTGHVVVVHAGDVAATALNQHLAVDIEDVTYFVVDADVVRGDAAADENVNCHMILPIGLLIWRLLA